MKSNKKVNLHVNQNALLAAFKIFWSTVYWGKFYIRYVSCSVVLQSLWPHGLVACQAPTSMEFPRQEEWSGQPSLSPGASSWLRDRIRPPVFQVDSLLSESPRKPTVRSITHLLDAQFNECWHRVTEPPQRSGPLFLREVWELVPFNNLSI